MRVRRLGTKLIALTGPQQVAIALIAYLAFIAIGEAQGVSYWHLLGVPAYPHVPFADLRVITAAWDCARTGIDPLITNPCDPFHRAMNYPRIWLQIGLALRLGASATVPIGVVFVFLYGISMVQSPGGSLAVARGYSSYSWSRRRG